MKQRRGSCTGRSGRSTWRPRERRRGCSAAPVTGPKCCVTATCCCTSVPRATTCSRFSFFSLHRPVSGVWCCFLRRSRRRPSAAVRASTDCSPSSTCWACRRASPTWWCSACSPTSRRASYSSRIPPDRCPSASKTRSVVVVFLKTISKSQRRLFRVFVFSGVPRRFVHRELFRAGPGPVPGRRFPRGTPGHAAARALQGGAVFFFSFLFLFFLKYRVFHPYLPTF